jgi:hypothetical protein
VLVWCRLDADQQVATSLADLAGARAQPLAVAEQGVIID